MLDRSDIVHTSIYVPKNLHRKLREAAITNDCKVHDLILRGIQAVLLLDGIMAQKKTISKRVSA